MKESIEKHSFKIQIATACTVIIFIIVGTYKFVNMKRDIDAEITTMTNQYNHCYKWYQAIEEVANVNAENNSAQDLLIVEIKTKLSNIEAMLVKIESKL